MLKFLKQIDHLKLFAEKSFLTLLISYKKSYWDLQVILHSWTETLGILERMQIINSNNQI